MIATEHLARAIALELHQVGQEVTPDEVLADAARAARSARNSDTPGVTQVFVLQGRLIGLRHARRAAAYRARALATRPGRPAAWVAAFVRRLFWRGKK